MTTPRLAAPEMATSQNGKEETHNEGLRHIEQGAGHFIIKDRDLAAPPGSPADGDCYLVAASPTGAWAGHAGDIAWRMNTEWKFTDVIEGFTFWVNDENKFLVATSASTFQEFETTVGTGGTFSVPILAAAMTARSSNGAAEGATETSTNKIMVATLDFDQSTDEFAQFMFPMPKSWNEGTVTAQFIWTAASTGDVVWGIQGVALSNDDALDSAFGAAQTVTDGVTAANDVMITSFTGAVTIGGTPAEGDLVVFQVYRDADNVADTLAVDAKLIGIRLNYTTNAGDDS